MVLFRRLLGDVLRGARRQRGMTLRELSAEARVSLGYISEIERGQKEASSELLASICDALDVELADLLAEVSLEMRVAGAGGVRALGQPVPADAADAAVPAEQPAAEETAVPAAEPALALVGGPARSALRRGETVSLAA